MSRDVSFDELSLAALTTRDDFRVVEENNEQLEMPGEVCD